MRLSEITSILSELNSWRGNLLEFKRSHSVLVIKLESPNSKQAVYLSFIDVIYYEGPVSWTGANLMLSSEEEYIALMDNLGIHGGIPVEYRKEMKLLFLIKNDIQDIKILAYPEIYYEKTGQ